MKKTGLVGLDINFNLASNFLQMRNMTLLLILNAALHYNDGEWKYNENDGEWK